MSHISMSLNERYTFAAAEGAPVLLHSTDHAGSTNVFNNNVEIKDLNGGTNQMLYIESDNTQTGAHQLYLRQKGTGDVGMMIYDGSTYWSIGIDNSADSALRFCESNALHVNNRMQLDSGGDLTIFGDCYAERFRGQGDTDSYMNINGTNIIDWYTGGAHEMRLENDGDLHVDGDIIAYSSTTSDIRLKKNIRPLSSSLETICKLDGVKFDWKYRDEKNQIGLIAQEVEKQIPEAIKEGTLPFYSNDEEEYKTINYDMIVPHLIESIKELKSEVDELKIKLENK